jgi:hypothetical protein
VAPDCILGRNLRDTRPMTWPPWKHTAPRPYPAARTDPPPIFPPRPSPTAAPAPQVTEDHLGSADQSEPLILSEQDRIPMSDDIASEAPVAAPVSPVLPEAPAVIVRPTGAAPSLDPSLRQALLGVGVQAGMLMMRANTTPEEVAAKVGLPLDLVLSMMTGREPDIGIRAMATIAKHLGGQLVIQLQPPAPPTAPSA